MRTTRADHTWARPDVSHQQACPGWYRWALMSGIPLAEHPLALSEGTTGHPNHQSRNRHGHKLEKGREDSGESRIHALKITFYEVRHRRGGMAEEGHMT